MRIGKYRYSDLISAPSSPWKDGFLLALILIVFYSLWLGSFPLFTPDEARYSEVAREMVVQHDYLTPRVNGVPFFDKPVLYYWLQAVSIHLFGLKEWAMRFFPMLIGVSGCLLVYGCGRYLFDRRTGLIASTILATTPLYFGSAHYADLNLEVAVFISAALLFFITAFIWEERNLSTKVSSFLLLAAFFFTGLAVLTKGLIGLVFPTLIIGNWLILLKRNIKKIMLPCLLGFFLLLVTVLPWYGLMQKTHPAFFHYFFIVQQASRFFSTNEFNNKMPIWFYIPIIIVGFFPWSSFLPQVISKNIKKTWNQPKQYQIELYLLLWIAIVLAFFSFPHSKIIGYILPIFPPLALLTGRWFSLAWENHKKGARVFQNESYVLIGLSLIFVGLLWLTAYKKWLDFSAQFLPYLFFMSFICLSLFMGSIILSRLKEIRLMFFFCLISISIMLLALVKGAQYLNQNTAKPLVTYLHTIIKPEDEVLMYYKYYYDLPFYLQKRVAITVDWNVQQIVQKDNWMREFWLGSQLEKTEGWLLKEDEFWKKWNRPQRIFVFVNKNYFTQFKKQAEYYFVLAQYQDILLLSNIPLRVGLKEEKFFDG